MAGDLPGTGESQKPAGGVGRPRISRTSAGAASPRQCSASLRPQPARHRLASRQPRRPGTRRYAESAPGFRAFTPAQPDPPGLSTRRSLAPQPAPSHPATPQLTRPYKGAGLYAQPTSRRLPGTASGRPLTGRAAPPPRRRGGASAAPAPPRGTGTAVRPPPRRRGLPPAAGLAPPGRAAAALPAPCPHPPRAQREASPAAAAAAAPPARSRPPAEPARAAAAAHARTAPRRPANSAPAQAHTHPPTPPTHPPPLHPPRRRACARGR